MITRDRRKRLVTRIAQAPRRDAREADGEQRITDVRPHERGESCPEDDRHCVHGRG